MGWYDGAYFMPLKDVLQALAIVLIWGVNFVVIKYGVADVPPLLLGALRFHAGGLSGGAAGAPAQAALGLGGGVWPVVGVGQFAFLFSAIKLGMPAGLASVVLQSQAFLP
jgi:O-acetylserine/cysteine efflux transporter